MKRTLIPKSTRDRIMAALALLIAGLLVFSIIVGIYGATIFFAVATGSFVAAAYGLQDRAPLTSGENEYLKIIEGIAGIGKQLSDLNVFLEKERRRIADTEATIRKLDSEKTKLEPLVQTHRQTVEAILAAHSARTAKHAWKERLLGFALGAIASLLASIVYGYLKK
jgi:septal ring factor EnvC (AmiA/AmiB activator)